MEGERTPRFRVLLAEDDAISRAFLIDAVRECGGEPVAFADGPSALRHARSDDWDLLILDHHLPGLDGDAVLAALRADAGPDGHAVAAIATTADPDGARARLLAAGFEDVLPKPLPLETLRAVLGRHGCPGLPVDIGVLDDGVALRACGSASAVARLRRLFAEQELPRVQDEVDHLADPRTLRPTLHRLRASCGFCGAVALARASEALHVALAAGPELSPIDGALDHFIRCVRETRTALHATLSGMD